VAAHLAGRPTGPTGKYQAARQPSLPLIISQKMDRKLIDVRPINLFIILFYSLSYLI